MTVNKITNLYKRIKEFKSLEPSESVNEVFSIVCCIGLNNFYHQTSIYFEVQLF